jgi:hypothetical protein
MLVMLVYQRVPYFSTNHDKHCQTLITTAVEAKPAQTVEPHDEPAETPWKVLLEKPV